MDKLKFTIHPLFFIFGLYFALTGKVFSFLVYTFTAVIHEMGHFFASSKLGYKLNRIVLMPYGALISGDIDDISYKDEALIALAGPLTNVLTALLFVALWWLFPSVYPYTDSAVLACVSIAVVNLLPCHPLDGGRFLKATLSLAFSKKVANIITRVLGVIVGLLVLALFIISCFNKVNFTILFFSLFILVGAISKSKQNVYVKVFSIYIDTVKKPTPICEYILPSNATVKTLYQIMQNGKRYKFYLQLSDGTLSRAIEGKVLNDLLTTHSPYDLLVDAI